MKYIAEFLRTILPQGLAKLHFNAAWALLSLVIGLTHTGVIMALFAGGEIFDKTFSILGAVIGGVGTAAVLLGLGAYFDAQEKKSPKSPPLNPEITGVFDRMITGKDNPTRKEVEAAKRKLRQAGK